MVEENLEFGEALKFLKEGGAVTRAGWNGKGMYIKLQVPDENSKMKKPYLYIKIVTGEFVPWVASNGDLLATDWSMVDILQYESSAVGS